MIDLLQFRDKLTDDIKRALQVFNACGFRAGIVGGVPRDYLLSSALSHDVDIELRPAPGINLEEDFKALLRELGKSFLVREKGQKVYQLIAKNQHERDQWDIEFTLPRVERFIAGVRHHNNFEAQFVEDRDYRLGFIRRDFTINAIMFEIFFDEIKLIDPLGGVDDLKHRLLRACDATHFVKDPVRFLRALRFKLLFDFNFHPDLSVLLAHMHVEKTGHFLSEVKKSAHQLEFFKLCHDVRPKEFNFWGMQDFMDIIRDYDRLTRHQPLHIVISQALFLPKKLRQDLIAWAQVKQSKLVDVDLKSVHLPKLTQMTTRELSLVSWVDGLIDFLNLAARLPDEMIDLFLGYYGRPFETSFVHRYIQAPSIMDPTVSDELKRYDIFRSKLTHLM